jgi:Skp family chaperone for outer membrane proteins
MKKVVLTATMILSLIILANAKPLVQNSTTVNQETIAVVVTQDEWKEVKLEDLNEKVQAAIKTLQKSNDVKSIVYNEASKQTKVAVISKVDSSEKEVIFNDEGEEIK